MSYPLGSVASDQRTEFYAEPENRRQRPRSRGWAAGLIALLVIGLFAGGLWFAYLQGMKHATGVGTEDVPLIRADAGPTKVKPEKPGGMEVPDRDKLIYTQKRAAVEHLLPAPEKPMPRPAAPGTPALQPGTSQPPAAPATTSSGAPATNASGKIATASKVTPKPGSAQPSTTPGEARMQLASVRSEEAAVQEWNRLKRANSDLLGNISVTPVRVDLGEKGVFYRVLSGPVADADRVCRELNQRKVGCIIAR